MYEYRFLMMSKYNQTEIASRLNQDQESKDQEES